tara:strand:- start:32516 stop:32824 length:309 start_codon:yes stop_codon:yes gene_type:complete
MAGRLHFTSRERDGVSNETDCPHCKNSMTCDDLELSWDDDSTEVECPTCGKIFEVTQSIDVSYSSKCLEKDHDWKTLAHETRVQHCERCDAMSVIPEKGDLF